MNNMTAVQVRGITFYMSGLLLLAGYTLSQGNSIYINGTKQIPKLEGNQLELKEDGVVKVVRRVWSDHPDFDTLLLNAIIGPFRMRRQQLREPGTRTRNYTITYNSCRDSNYVELNCLEAQISLWGAVHHFSTISFGLYNKSDEYMYKRFPDVSLLQPSLPGSFDVPSTISPTETSPGPAIPGNAGSSTGALNDVGKGGYILAGVVTVAFLVTIAVVVAVVKCHRNRKNSDVEKVKVEAEANNSDTL